MGPPSRWVGLGTSEAAHGRHGHSWRCIALTPRTRRRYRLARALRSTAVDRRLFVVTRHAVPGDVGFALG